MLKLSANGVPRFGGVVGVVLAATVFGGCGSGSATPEGDPGAAGGTGGAEVHRYTVRGEVMAVSTTGPAGRQIVVHHEAVPKFHTIEGKVETMEPMSMTFPVASKVDLEGIEAGRAIRFTFEVDWDQGAYRVTSLKPLPQGTVLDFGGAGALGMASEEPKPKPKNPATEPEGTQ